MEGSISQASASWGSDQRDRVGLSRGFRGLDGALRDPHPDQRTGWLKVSVWWRWDSSTLGRWHGWGCGVRTVARCRKGLAGMRGTRGLQGCLQLRDEAGVGSRVDVCSHIMRLSAS